MIDSKQTCDNCRYYDPGESSMHDTGDCRRHAPIIPLCQIEEEHGHPGVWPFVLAEDWCGDWQGHDKVVIP